MTDLSYIEQEFNEVSEYLYAKYGEDYSDGYIDFNLSTNGSEYYVRYLGHIIWSDSDDEREFYEETNEYEPLSNFLKERIKAFNRMIGV